MAKKPNRPTPSGGSPQRQQEITFQINGPTIAGQLGFGDVTPLIRALENNRGSRVVCIVYNDLVQSMLAPPAIAHLEYILRRLGHIPKLDVFLRSTGGMTEVPWRIVSLLREFTDELGIIISKVALSGGCHIALAGDDLVMTPFAVLGSVDPTRMHALLPKDAEGNPIPTSVQDLKHCIQFIKEQLGESYSSQNLALIISELFKYIDPLALGALEQSYNLARLITKKVLKTRKAALEDEHIDKIVDILAGQYFSHSFLISRADVEADLKLPITKPDTILSGLIENLNDYYDANFQKAAPASPSNREPIVRVGAFMQTTSEGFIISQLFNQANELFADPWIRTYPDDEEK